MLLLKMGPEVPSRARRALPALCRSDKEDGRRPSEFLVSINMSIQYIATLYPNNIPQKYTQTIYPYDVSVQYIDIIYLYNISIQYPSIQDIYLIYIHTIYIHTPASPQFQARNIHSFLFNSRESMHLKLDT